MDSPVSDFSYLINEFDLNGETIHPSPNHDPGIENGSSFEDNSFNFVDFPSPPSDPVPDNVASTSDVSPEVDSPDDNDFSDTVFKFIREMLLEENIEKKSCMFHDPLALQAAEKSFYEVIGEEYIPSPNQTPICIDIPDHFSSDQSISSGNSTTNSIGWGLVFEQAETEPSSSQSFSHPVNRASQSASQMPLSCPDNPSGSFNGLMYSSANTLPVPNILTQDESLSLFRGGEEEASQMPLSCPDNPSGSFSGLMESSASTLLVPNILTQGDSVSLFRRGEEEASKFLPPESLLIADTENYKFPLQSKDVSSDRVVEVETNEKARLPNGSRGRKNHHREDVDIDDARSTKQSAVFVDEEDELLDLFDRVLLCPYSQENLPECAAVEVGQNGGDNLLPQSGQTRGVETGKSRPRKRGSKKEVVDLRTLLILCAQAANADDRRTADELLKQIRQHSFPFGDGSQRVAHYFVDALEARLAGRGTQIYTSLDPKLTAADMLKAYQLYLSACPFKNVAISFANYHILKLAEKATTVHIIDFGIRYGFHWPMFIQSLSNRRGRLSKLRITGIELPQPGFRPAERVEETGRRLASYCERFNVPFQYNAIAKKWETIQIEDLKIDINEAIAVNCFYRLENMLDETVVVSSPRDAVLKLIRKINPDIFTHSLLSGSYNSPYFITRFREALFHFSALFDMFDTNLPREDQDRLMFEKGFYGREIMNVIACEGSERVVRPEMYKQWQVRIQRAGFRQLPLDRELMKKLRTKAIHGYHKDFHVNEDGNWMLQGWKGRIINAASCWVPAEESL